LGAFPPSARSIAAEAGVRDAVLGNGSSFRASVLVEFPSPDVVDRADIASAEHRGREQPAGPGGPHLGVPPARRTDNRLLLLCAQSKIVEVEMSAEDAATLISPAAWCSPLRSAKEGRSARRAWRTRADRQFIRAAAGAVKVE